LVTELRALSEKIDPRKKQLSLELDLPPAPIKEPIRERSREKRSSRSLRTPPPVSSIEEKEEDAVKKEKTSPGKVSAKKKVSSRVKRNRLIATILALLIGGGIWYGFLGPGSKVVVPSIAGLTVKDATKQLADLGLTLSVKTEEFSEDIPQGKIISSDPAGGGRVAPNGSVEAIVSKGKERYDIPDLKGLAQDAAVGVLTKTNLTLGDVQEEFSAEIPLGYIIRTTPPAGEKVKRNSQVSIVVSKGIEQVALADYKGKTGEQALNELTDAGFDVQSQYVFSEDLPAGVVISQTPGAGNADKGAKITLIISKGSEFVYVPNLFAMSEAKAVGMLKDLQLKPVVKKVGTKKVK
ncbi:MAG: PASTA domain-containing protein, partial [Actinobacteria bacterium]|nr:PASTA domain-containing protein [Actinomycetota bacterium]